jgi:hypothetical protein
MGRALLALVVLANVLFFAWSRGVLAPAFPPPHAGEREPERLAAQIRPEAVLVLPAPAASAAISAARAAALACLEAGPFAEAAVAAAEAVLAAAGLPEGLWRRQGGVPPASWLVFAGRAVDAAGLRTRADELKKLGLEFEIIDSPAELANGFVLSRHADKAGADAALAAAAALGLRNGRVVQLPAPAPLFWLRAARADTDVQDKLRALTPESMAGGFKPCAGVASSAPASGVASAPVPAAPASSAPAAAVPGSAAVAPSVSAAPSAVSR